MVVVYIISVEGKANSKDLSILKKTSNVNFELDKINKKGWSANLESRAEAELLAMRLRVANLSKKYFLNTTEADGRTKIGDAINLF